MAFAGVFASTFDSDFISKSWNFWMFLIYFSGLLCLGLNAPDFKESEKFKKWMVVGAVKTVISMLIFVPL